MDQEFVTFLIIGFLAQVIDGALGMAYGVTSTTFLLGAGLPPALASASVHTAEVFTTGVSGLSHLRLGNVDRTLALRLIVPGVSGGVLGAFILTTLPEETIRPFVAVYLLIMGMLILRKAMINVQGKTVTTRLVPLGLVGGLLDAIGGGGWGPVVTSTLLARGNSPRTTIGSVNAAEFFVTTCQAATFVALLGVVHWKVTLGLIAGGVLAAPLAAHVCARMPARALMTVVGTLVVVLSVRTISLSL